MTGASTVRAGNLAASRLASLFPSIGPWTSAALWHGRAPTVDPPDSPLAEELETIAEQRLSGLLLRYLRDSGAVVDPDDMDVLRDDAFAWTARSFAVLDHTRPALELLHECGIDFAVAKGPGIAKLYPSLDCRPYSDIDLVVGPRQFAAAVAALERRGWIEQDYNRQPWDYFRFRCREGLNLIHAGGGSVDLHHRVPPWIWSRHLDVESAAVRAGTVHMPGLDLPCFASVDNLLVAALHVVSDRNRPGMSLIVWRDLVELANATEVGAVVAAARAARLAGWLKAVLTALPGPFGTSALRSALPDDPIPHRRRLAMLLAPGADDFGVMGSQLLRLPPANGLAFAAGMAVPSPSFLRAKYPDTAHRYRRWWSNSRGRLARSSGVSGASGAEG